MVPVLKKMLIGTTLLGVVGYVSLCGAMWYWQTSFMLFPRVGLERSPKDLGLTFEEWQIASGSGQVVAWKITPATGAQQWLLHCHGNGGNIAGRLEMARELCRHGIGVVLFDYRGYGRSTGTITRESELFEDAQVVYDRLSQTHQPIWIYGESLGGGVASYLAEKNPCRGLVLQSTFTSFTERAHENYPFLPISRISRFEMNTRGRLGHLKVPVLVIHGTRDEVIGLRHGQALFAAACEPKTWVEVPGGFHDLPEDVLAEAVSTWMAGVR